MNPASTAAGGPFPTTKWTLIRDAKDPDSPQYRASVEQLAALYWRPVYAYFRRKWGRRHDEAADLAQEFFLALCERNFLQRLSPELGRFRRYVQAALDNFARLEHRQRSAQKRGGDALQVPIDPGDGFLPSATGTPEEVFDREWARAVLSESLGELRTELAAAGQETSFRLFSERDLDPPPGGEPASYEDLAARHGLAVTDVTNLLYRTRKRLREIVLRKVRDTVSSEGDAEAEMRELFGRRLSE